MLQINNRNITSNIARFRVVFKMAEDFDITGTLYNDSYGFAIDFEGIRQMLSRLDEFFDYVNFPQATHDKRSFNMETGKQRPSQPRGLRDPSTDEMNDKRSNFLLHVQFRQHSTWQGTLEWTDQKRTRRFHSELEMIKMILEETKI